MALVLVVDTCVWLDLARDHRNGPALGALQHLLADKKVKLIVPDLVVEEFERNEPRIIADAKRSLQSHFRLVRDAVTRFGDDDYRDSTLSALNEVDRKTTLKGDGVADEVKRVREILKSVKPLKLSVAIKQRVTDRALAKKAPFHRDKNSAADAILIETYADLVGRNTSDQLAFVTHNTKDFSEPDGDRRNPHPDLAALFVRKRSTYWTSLVDLLKAREPQLLDDVDAEWNYSDEPRRLAEILDAENLLFRQVWYNRHQVQRERIEAGIVQVVSRDVWEKHPKQQIEVFVDEVWRSARRAAKRTENEVGLENLGPWDDFEWGMLNGKLSALRWVLGDEWDMLDT